MRKLIIFLALIFVFTMPVMAEEVSETPVLQGEELSLGEAEVSQEEAASIEEEVAPLAGEEVTASAEEVAVGEEPVAEEVDTPEPVAEEVDASEVTEAVVEEVFMAPEEPEEAGKPEWVSDADPAFIEPLEELPDLEEYGTSSFGIERVGVGKFTYYAQRAYQCKTGYSILEAYVKNAEGKYTGHLFFVYDQDTNYEGEEWLRYDYTEMAANTFLSASEQKESNGKTLYAPVVKTSGGKNVLQSDNSKTAIDESRIPVIAESDAVGINFAWKSLSEIPFAKSGTTYEYAGEATKEDPEPEPPTPGGERTTSTTINGHSYTIKWTAAVYYDGRSHLWNMSKISSKNKAKQVADINVEIIRDEALVSTSNYTVTCKNNKNVTGYAGNKKNQPYFSITLKGNYKKDNAKMSKGKLPFDIVPKPLSEGTLQAKKVVIQGSKTTFSDLYYIFADGRKVKMTAYNAKKKTGTYTTTVAEEGVQITGYNNFSGTGMLSMANPKKVTYEW